MRQLNGTAAAASADGMARALEDYLAAAEAGTAPPREEFLARHPELAEDLDACLAALRFIGRAAEAPRAVAAEVAGAEPPDAAAGQLGDFRLIREVGRGGMGVVYEAEQISLGRRVALKVLPFAATMDPRQLQRFHNEARAAASLDHPHIVHVHAVGCERAVHFYAMQFIEGQTLAAMIADLRRAGGKPVAVEAQATTPHVPDAPAPAADTAPHAAASTQRGPRDRAYFRRAAELGVQAAEALDHAHALGVVHRDVKPANLLVDGHGGLWVTDFGLAHIQSDARLTMTGDLVGTLRYMSPEQALAKRVVIDHRTDVYSLGATLYELLTLEPAFAGSDRQELLRQIAFEEPKPPRRVNKAIPGELETIVLKAMEKNPAERYATAKELADDLRRWLEDKSIRARPPSPLQRMRKWGRRHRPAVTAAAVALVSVLVALGAGAGWLLGDRTARQREAEGKVEEALAAAEPGLRQGNPWDHELIAAAQRAEAQLGGGAVRPELRRRVEQLQKDVRMLAELERIRLDKANVRDGHFDSRSADPQYASAFRDYGIDVETLAPDEAAAQVQGSAICEHLAAGLDDWALSQGIKSGREEKARRLLAAARQADPDPWRNRLREAVLTGDVSDELVRSAPVEELPAATLGLLGTLLERAKTFGPEVELLRRAQRRYAADFWISQELAYALYSSQPPRLEEAIGFYRAAVALRPESPGVRLNLGQALYDQGKPGESEQEYRQALRLKSDYAEAHEHLGTSLVDQGKLMEAEKEFRGALRIKPDFPEAHYSLGLLLAKQRKAAEAEAEYREAIRLKPDYAQAHDNLGNLLKDQGRYAGAEYAEAEKGYKEEIRLRPDDPKAHYNLGVLWDELKRPAEAEAEYREALRLRPDDPAAHQNLGTLLKGQDKHAEAEKEYREAIRLNPDYPNAHDNLGALLAGQGKAAEAEKEFREALRLKPDHPNAHYNLGVLLKGQNKAAEAEKEFREALRRRPDYSEAHINLGILLAEQNKAPEAEKEFREGLRIKPDDPEAHYSLGLLLMNQNKAAEAEKEYREALRLKPDFPDAHCNLGALLAERNKPAEAEKEFREALRLKPDSPVAHNNLGTLLYRQGQAAEAEVEYREALRVKPDYLEAHYNLGFLLANLGKPADAEKEYRGAIRIKPDYPEAHCNLGGVLRDQGRFLEALAELRRGHELGARDPRWPYPSGQWVKECERLAELDAVLPAVIQGRAEPAGANMTFSLAWVCEHTRRYAAAARFRATLMAAEPRLAADPTTGVRYAAACSAALAGCGRGEDAQDLDDQERTRWREQSLKWLRADLTPWRRLAATGADKDRAEVQHTLRHWQQDPDLAGVRDPDALARLPEAEQEAWRALWSDVQKTLTSLEKDASPEEKKPETPKPPG
jgi:Flp pilus assembly protein TadD/serine/threonine protein kinase